MNATDLHWTESKIEKIEVSGRDLIIWANNVFSSESSEPCKIKVIFKDVLESKREVIEYIGDPKGNPNFKKSYIVQDIPTVEEPGKYETYGLEGITTFEPIAWIDWEIKAKEIDVIQI